VVVLLNAKEKGIIDELKPLFVNKKIRLSREPYELELANEKI